MLQANYRGSDGYGLDWIGQGAFHGWQTVVDDLDAGVSHLIAKGVADPDRVCMVGWSYGGYAALITAIERGARFRCAVSIAPVTHPYDLYAESRGASFRGRALRELIPREGAVVRANSPLERVEELAVPALVLHGEQDLNVSVDQSRDFAKAARQAEKDVEYVEYEGIDHYFDREEQRVDMLRRVGEFLAKHLAKKPKVASASN